MSALRPLRTCSTQIEEYDLVDKARPADQKMSSQWETALRGGGTRYILIGNIFSGLYCPVKEESKPIKQVCERGPHLRVVLASFSLMFRCRLCCLCCNRFCRVVSCCCRVF